MAHVPPKTVDELTEMAPLLNGIEASMGFVPNSLLTMAHMPQLPAAFSMLAGVAFGADLKQQIRVLDPLVPPADQTSALPSSLLNLVAFAVSIASGSRYCQAHCSLGAHKTGISEEKLAEIHRFQESESFSAAERAALALAFAAGGTPNESKVSHFEALRAHFDEQQIVQLVAVIALFGFLNRWNDTLATALESEPGAFATKALSSIGWAAGKHQT